MSIAYETDSIFIQHIMPYLTFEQLWVKLPRKFIHLKVCTDNFYVVSSVNSHEVAYFFFQMTAWTFVVKNNFLPQFSTKSAAPS
jgi:hypothetical protein